MRWLKRPLPRSFYARPTVETARDLLGKILVRGDAAARIVETEAYLGEGDLAAHSAAGITDRTRVIFGPAGHAYIYLSYGVHHCLDVVAEQDGRPGCVLIRAAEPIAGIDGMRARRPKAKRLRDLASGPGKLAAALGLTLEQNGLDVTRPGELTIHEPCPKGEFEIAVGPRVGISKSVELPLRFWIADNEHVSR